MDEITVSQSGSFLAPVISVQDALQRYQAVKDFILLILRDGIDFGIIPGTGDKPVLLKPGAEKLCAFFGMNARIIEREAVEDWVGENHGGEPFFYYRYRVGLYRGDVLIADNDGSANSWERKYRYRNADRTCPVCGKTTIIKGLEKYGGGYVCYAKKGGCGAKFSAHDPNIVNQIIGQVKNPDPADLVNTLQKIAYKRAFVGAVLIATNASDSFTQDIDEFVDAEAYVSPTETLLQQNHAADNNSKREKPSDSVTKFWAKAHELGISREDGLSIIREHNNDFEAALKSIE